MTACMNLVYAPVRHPADLGSLSLPKSRSAGSVRRHWRRVSAQGASSDLGTPLPEPSAPKARVAGQAGPSSSSQPAVVDERDAAPMEAVSYTGTGFPVPTGYSNPGNIYSYWRRAGQAAGLAEPASAAPTETAALPPADSPADAASALPPGRQRQQLKWGHVDEEMAGGHYASSPAASAPINPVFRSAPYAAELARQRRYGDTVRILVLDEGNTCRSVLAAAVLQYMLSRLRVPLDVTVECASIGWCAPGPHDPRVARIAHEMTIQLPQRSSREFDELEDCVSYDLVLVMDRFDLEEVMREASVLERINPQGHYSSRVRRLGSFGAASLRAIPGQFGDDIPDPLYSAPSRAAEHAALRATVHRIAFACRGLVHCLAQLRLRTQGRMPLRRALAVSLQCPLLCPEVMRGRERLAVKWRPVWQQGGDLYTIRWSGQQRRVVKRASNLVCSSGKPRGYWRDAANVELELREWMERHGMADRLPTSKQLRESGANTLDMSITSLGGLAEFSRRMGLPMSCRHPNGYWRDFANLAAELEPFLAGTMGGGGNGSSGRMSRQGGPRLLAGGRGRGRPPAGSKAATAAAAAEQPAAAPLPPPRVLPRPSQLLAAGRTDLVAAIRLHGGSAEVARRLGATLARNKLHSAELVCEELQRFMAAQQAQQAAQQGPSGGGSRLLRREAQWLRASLAMPTQAELCAAGRKDLYIAIRRFGGLHYFARILGLDQEESAPPAAAAAAAAPAAPAAGAAGADVGEAAATAGTEASNAAQLGGDMAAGSSSAGSSGSYWEGSQVGDAHAAALPAVIPLENGTSLSSTAPLSAASSQGSAAPAGGHAPSMRRLSNGSLGGASLLGERGGASALLNSSNGTQQQQAGPEAAPAVAATPQARRQQRRSRNSTNGSSGNGNGSSSSSSSSSSDIESPAGALPQAMPVTAPQHTAALPVDDVVASVAGIPGTASVTGSSSWEGAISGEVLAARQPALAQPGMDQPASPEAPSSISTPAGSGVGVLPAAAAGAANFEHPLPPPPSAVSVGEALLEYMYTTGHDANTLPSRQELLRAGRHDLAYAMLRAGGGRRLAEQLGLEFEERRGRKRKHAREKASRLPPRPEGSALDDFVLI